MYVNHGDTENTEITLFLRVLVHCCPAKVNRRERNVLKSLILYVVSKI
jgi:hypothetical protein